jgi:hypothetical protein
VTFRFLFRALAASLEPLASNRSPTWVPPPVTFSRSPLCRIHPLRLLRVHRSALSGRRFQAPTHVPSSWSLTTSTVYSASGSRVCCAPLPTMGFAAFRAWPFHHRLRTNPVTPWSDIRSPRDAIHTLRRVPLISSRTAFPRPLPSCRSPAPLALVPPATHRFQWPLPTPPPERARLQGFAPLTSPFRPVTVASRASFAPPMGFVPLQDPLASAAALSRIRAPAANRGTRLQQSFGWRITRSRAATSLQESPSPTHPRVRRRADTA